MTTLLNRLNALSAAEEFFEFFAVPYVPAVVHVHRLHILKRFHQYLRATPGLWEKNLEQQHATCKQLLLRAYEDFVHSTAAREKVFKVFQDQEGSHVSLDRLRATLPSKA
ncbi:MAG: nitrogenase-stabilizing/protective protein NifW [Pseudomonadota bacterium]